MKTGILMWSLSRGVGMRNALGFGCGVLLMVVFLMGMLAVQERVKTYECERRVAE